MDIEYGQSLGKVKVANLQYGGTCEFNGSTYMKINKKKVGIHIQMTWTPRHCILANLKTGSLRALVGDELVTVKKSMCRLFDVRNSDEESALMKGY